MRDSWTDKLIDLMFTLLALLIAIAFIGTIVVLLTPAILKALAIGIYG